MPGLTYISCFLQIRFSSETTPVQGLPEPSGSHCVEDMAQAWIIECSPGQGKSEPREIHSLAPLQSAFLQRLRLSGSLDKIQVHWRFLFMDLNFHPWVDFSCISNLGASYGCGSGWFSATFEGKMGQSCHAFRNRLTNSDISGMVQTNRCVQTHWLNIQVN